jgi:hypothetical protein
MPYSIIVQPTDKASQRHQRAPLRGEAYYFTLVMPGATRHHLENVIEPDLPFGGFDRVILANVDFDSRPIINGGAKGNWPLFREVLSSIR